MRLTVSLMDRLRACAETCVVVRDEVQTTMRLLGVTKLTQLGPHLVSSVAAQLCQHLYIYPYS